MLEVASPVLTKSKMKRLIRKGYTIEDIEKQFGANKPQQPVFRLKSIRPKTINQSRIFKAFGEGKNLNLHGLPGTGKTFVAMYLALNLVFDAHTYQSVKIIRSVVPTRDIGFLPGKQEDKIAVYEAPYQGICAELFGRGDAYKKLKETKQIEFIPTSFIRGSTWNDCIVIVDEMQNMTEHELDSIITRIGDNCRIIFCGDFRQSDLRFNDEKQGLHNFMEVIDRMKSFAHIELEIEDIVRSGLVKEYIITKFQLGRI